MIFTRITTKGKRPRLSPVPEELTTPRTTDGNTTTHPNKGEDRDAEDEEEQGPAGVGEIAAWLLAGLAFFLVLVLALALCTRMRPENATYQEDQNADYLASVGYLSQPREGSRELGRCLFICFLCLYVCFKGVVTTWISLLPILQLI